MKKLLAVLLTTCIIASLVVVSVSAAIDARRLEEYGQLHFYLGDPVTSADAPNSEDAKINEDEYSLKLDISEIIENGFKGHNDDKGVTAGYVTCSDYMFYLDYDSKYIYVGFSKIDPDFVAAHQRKNASGADVTLGETVGRTAGDGFRFSMNISDRPDTRSQISRTTFDIYFDEDYSPVIDLWSNDFDPNGTKLRTVTEDVENLSDYVKKSSGSYDEDTGLLVAELAISVEAITNYWGAESLEWAGIILKYHRFGEASEGSDVMNANQGRLDFAFDYPENDTPEKDIEFLFKVDHPDATFFAYRGSNIVHFHAEDDEGDCPLHAVEGGDTGGEGGDTGNEGGDTGNEGGDTGNEGGDTGNEGGDGATQPPTQAPTSAPATTPAPTEEGGCGSAISLAALAVIPALAVAFVAKKKEE